MLEDDRNIWYNYGFKVWVGTQGYNWGGGGQEGAESMFAQVVGLSPSFWLQGHSLKMIFVYELYT